MVVVDKITSVPSVAVVDKITTDAAVVVVDQSSTDSPVVVVDHTDFSNHGENGGAVSGSEEVVFLRVQWVY